MSEHVAYIVFLTVVGLGLAALSVALAVVAFPARTPAVALETVTGG